MPEDNQLELKKHRKLIRICLAVLPSDYAVFQTSKPTVLFFLLSSLELLGDLDRQLSAATKRRMISSVYSLQLKPQQLTSDLPLHKCGFLGSASCSTDPNVVCPYDGAHIAQTYTALCSLLLLGDDLAQVDRVSLLKALRCFQSEDGSFFGTGDGHSENDMRFVFCASAICYILDDFAQIDVESMCAFIRRSVNYDGGIGQGPGLESHGGSTYCAVAALALVGRLWDGTVLGGAQLERLKGWLLLKQGQGFHGRTNKPDDSCYAFWIGATLTVSGNGNYGRAFQLSTTNNLPG